MAVNSRSTMLSFLSGLRAYIVILPVCAGIFIAADDQTSVVAILPDLLADLHVSVNELDRGSWTITGYLIGFTAAMPIMGRVSDRFGHRAVFTGALAIFMVGSALVAMSPDLPRLLLGRDDPELSWMVAARVLQAIGGGAVIPVAIASVGDLLPSHRHAVAFGLIGASAEAGGVIGPLWGGAIASLWSWEWVFWINIPMGLAVVAAVFLTPPGVKRPVRVDMVGGVLFVATLSLLTAGLSRAGQMDAGLIVLMAGALGALAATVVWHRRARDPIVPHTLLRNTRFHAANAAHFLVGAALISAMVTVPLMANTVQGSTALEGGLKLLRMTVAIPVGAVLGGYWVQRQGARPPALAGIALAAAGLFAMSRWTLDIADPWMTVHLAVAGAGFGLLIAPIIWAALENVRSGERGTASALVTVSRMVGMTVGLAALTAWGTVRYQNLAEGLPPFSFDPAQQAAFLEQAAEAGMTVFRGFFLAAAVAMALATAPALIMTRRSARRTDAAEEPVAAAPTTDPRIRHQKG